MNISETSLKWLRDIEVKRYLEAKQRLHVAREMVRLAEQEAERAREVVEILQGREDRGKPIDSSERLETRLPGISVKLPL